MILCFHEKDEILTFIDMYESLKDVLYLEKTALFQYVTYSVVTVRIIWGFVFLQ